MLFILWFWSVYKSIYGISINQIDRCYSYYIWIFFPEIELSKITEEQHQQVLPSYKRTAEDDDALQQQQFEVRSLVKSDELVNCTLGLQQPVTDETAVAAMETLTDEEKPIVALEKERVCMQPVQDDEYMDVLGHQQQLSSLSDLVSRHSIDSLDLQDCGHNTEDPDDGNYPGSCLSAEDSGIHTEDMSSCVSQADDEEQANMQPSPVLQLQHVSNVVQQERQEHDHHNHYHQHVNDTYNMVSVIARVPNII